jgi:hypothetical protein
MAETSDDYYIICPHCGHKTRDDDYTVTEDPDVWECGNEDCGKEFSVHKTVSITYHTATLADVLERRK